MNYDTWKTTPPDDDPEGDAFALRQEEDRRCPACGAWDDDPCEDGCACPACVRTREEGAA